MLPSSDKIESARRFASDLRRIRESNGISVDTLLERTKASPDVLETFEETALVDHPLYNRVYLRVFVRMYAEAIELDPDVAVEAADAMLDGTYRGELAAQFLDEESDSTADDAPDASADEAPEPLADEDLEHGSSDASDASADDDPEAEGEAEPEPPADDETKRAADDGPEPSADVAPDASADDDPEAEESQDTPRPPDAEQTASDSVAPGITDDAGSESDDEDGATDEDDGRRLPETGGIPGWIGHFKWILPGVVVVFLTALMLFGRSDEATVEDRVETVPLSASDSMTVLDDTMATLDFPPRVVLGDTVRMWIVAARDTLNPIRVTTDDDIRRPYWKDMGDSLEFRFTDRVSVHSRTSVVEFSVAGQRLPIADSLRGEPIHLTREQLQSILDSLRMVQ